jgi:hypothetical protein
MLNDFGVKFPMIGVRIAFQNQTKTVVKRAGLKIKIPVTQCITGN